MDTNEKENCQKSLLNSRFSFQTLGDMKLNVQCRRGACMTVMHFQGLVSPIGPPARWAPLSLSAEGFVKANETNCFLLHAYIFSLVLRSLKDKQRDIAG